MKLSQDLISFIETVVRTGQSVNIDNVIIEPDMVRAIDDARTVVLYQNTNVPEMPFGSIGLNRIGVFLSRLEIAKSQDNFTLDVIVDDDAESAGSCLSLFKKCQPNHAFYQRWLSRAHWLQS